MLSRSSALVVSLSSLSVRGAAGNVPGSRRAGSIRTGYRPRSAGAKPLRAAASKTTTASFRKQSDDETYDLLAKQYEQFQHINRTFELVAKAVSPAVVHIVAEKSSRGDESKRPRSFEETGSGVIVRSARERWTLCLNEPPCH